MQEVCGEWTGCGRRDAGGCQKKKACARRAAGDEVRGGWQALEVTGQAMRTTMDDLRRMWLRWWAGARVATYVSSMRNPRSEHCFWPRETPSQSASGMYVPVGELFRNRSVFPALLTAFELVRPTSAPDGL